MEKLPAEVKSMICGLLPQQDAATLRLTSKEFAHIGARHSHRRLIVNISPAHVNKITNIGNAQHIANHVHHLAIDCNALVPTSNGVKTWEDFVEYHEHSVRSHIGASELNAKQQKQRYQDHVDYVTKNAELWKHLNETLREIFQYLPRLKKVEIGDHFVEQNSMEPWKTRDAGDIITRANRLSMRDQYSRKVWTKQVHNSIAHIAGELPATVDEITLTFPGNARTMTPLSQGSVLGLKILPLAPGIKQSLKTLELRQVGKLGNHFELPFHAFENLQNLTLIGSTMKLHPINQFCIVPLCNGTPLRALREVVLHSVQVDREDLLEFLKGAKALKWVELQRCQIGAKTWANLYAQVGHRNKGKQGLVMGAELVATPNARDKVRHLEGFIVRYEEPGRPKSSLSRQFQGYLDSADRRRWGEVDVAHATRSLKYMQKLRLSER
ncbi:hypothetical protein BJ166DRAFT_616515 [Pestalotiopsis sp. NC0098]|nr:hypothetical protein BJ166DRAFT_616515 [Pestalotiopsis sp. NC0098]